MDAGELRQVVDAVALLLSRGGQITLRGAQWVQIGSHPDGQIFVYSERHPQATLYLPAEQRLAINRMLELLRA
jgi:hypothetical protein